MDHGVKFQCVYFGYPFPKKQFLFTSSVTLVGGIFQKTTKMIHSIFLLTIEFRKIELLLFC